MSDLTTQPKAWHTLHSKEGLEQLGVDPEGGLSSPDVDQRLKQYGPNVMTETKEEPLWLQFVKQYKDYMRIVLTIAAVASFIVGDFSTGVILLIITAGKCLYSPEPGAPGRGKCSSPEQHDAGNCACSPRRANR